jgi:ATP-binding cassette subfamily B protein
MTTSLERDLERVAGDGPASPFEPLAIDARSAPPLGHVDPDQSKGWLARMRPLIAARKWRFTGALVAAFIAMVAQVAVPRVVMAAIDLALTKRTTTVVPFVIALLTLAVVRGILTYGYRISLYGVAYRLEYDLRVGIYEHLTRMSFTFYDKVQTGQLVSRANSDIRSVQMFLTFAPLMALNAATFVIAFALMLAVNVPLAIVALAPLPFVYVAGRKLRSLLFPISWIVQARQAEVATIVEENVTGNRVVKSFAAESRQVSLLASAAERLRWASVRQIDARASWAPVMENLPRLGMAAVLLYGGWLAIGGSVTVGTIVAFSTYVVLLQSPFRMLGFLMMLSQRASASATRIFEILDTQPTIVDRPGAVDLVDPVGRVELDDVTFGYGDGRPVLDGFSLTVEPGETVAIVGRTGSGKSTVARLLCRFYDVDAGAVRVDGRDVRDVSMVSLRAAVGVVLDEPFLFSASVRDNIAYAKPGAGIEDVEAAARAARADGFISHLPDGYDTLVGERGYTLSGGQRQRIAIARTLLADPRVLVLDDATSAIDVRVEEEIHLALQELLAERTTIVIAHRLSTISLADRVVLVEGGRVAASGTHEELLERDPRYAAVLASIDAPDEELAIAGEPV